MTRFTVSLVAGVAVGLFGARAHAKSCPPDSVQVGPACIDIYEASVWSIPATNASLIKKVQDGKAVLADLTGGGATQISPSPACLPAFPGTFPFSGNWTAPLYAASIPGVHPTACVSWLQAEQACLLSGKRLLTNREWQGAAAGTPDPGTDNLSSDCAVSSPDVVDTGSRSSCKSSWGAFDMVGNVSEWVGDWADRAIYGCADWTTEQHIAGGDLSCFGGDGNGGGDPARIPGALIRGGSWNEGTFAGVFTVYASAPPASAGFAIGFRCAR